MPIEKIAHYHELKTLLEKEGFTVSDYQLISYGLQFQISAQKQKGLIRIYEGKKGVRVDLSQVKDAALLSKVETLINPSQCISAKPKVSKENICDLYFGIPQKNSANIIGLDESGKGDYFGPLVMAGCCVDTKTATLFQKWGLMDSKKLSDSKIKELAQKIKKTCPFYILCMSPIQYNRAYEQFKNLNYLLASGHAVVLEELLSKVKCEDALLDQFARKTLIYDFLKEKSKKIRLHQTPKAESNIAVAAASILARDTFVEEVKKLRSQFQFEFPLGVPSNMASVIKKFTEIHGKEKLSQVAKVHFKIKT